MLRAWLIPQVIWCYHVWSLGFISSQPKLLKDTRDWVCLAVMIENEISNPCQEINVTSVTPKILGWRANYNKLEFPGKVLVFQKKNLEEIVKMEWISLLIYYTGWSCKWIISEIFSKCGPLFYFLRKFNKIVKDNLLDHLFYWLNRFWLFMFQFIYWKICMYNLEV